MTSRPPHDRNEPRDDRVDAAWRAASREEPPAALDDAIRAAARREIGAGPVRAARPVPEATSPERWWWPLAAAATIGAIAIGVLQIVGTDPAGVSTDERTVVSDVPNGRAAPIAPAAPAATVASTTTATDSAGSAKPAPKRALPPSIEDRTAPPAATPPTEAPAVAPARSVAPSASRVAPSPPAAAPVAPPPPLGAMPSTAAAPAAHAKLDAAPDVHAPAPFPAAPVPPEARGDARRGTDASPAAAGPRREAPPATAKQAAETASGADARAQGHAPLPAAEWVSLIRRLRDEGSFDEAAKELAAFRAAYPDHERRLPPDLRDWKPPPR